MNNIIGCTYFGEANEFIDKFKPSRTNISEDDADSFLAQVARLEADPKKGMIDEYFDGLIDYEEYWAEIEEEKQLRENLLGFLKTKVPQLAKEADLGLRGIAIVDSNWKHSWHTYPRYSIYAWESNKQAESVDNDIFWEQFEAKIVKAYNEALESQFDESKHWVCRDYILTLYDSRMWTQQDAMCSHGRYITFFESPIKRVKHCRNLMLNRAKKLSCVN